MQFKALLALVGAAAAQCPPRNPDGFAAGDDLAFWMEESINGFFPYRAGWDETFDAVFSPSVKASFNATQLDFTGLRSLFENIVPGLEQGFAGTFVHGFLTTVAVPNTANTGGFVYVTGWQGGLLGGDESKPVNVTDAAFAVVAEGADCERTIVEWRESSNLGF